MVITNLMPHFSPLEVVVSKNNSSLELAFKPVLLELEEVSIKDLGRVSPLEHKNDCCHQREPCSIGEGC